MRLYLGAMMRLAPNGAVKAAARPQYIRKASGKDENSANMSGLSESQARTYDVQQGWRISVHTILKN